MRRLLPFSFVLNTSNSAPAKAECKGLGGGRLQQGFQIPVSCMWMHVLKSRNDPLPFLYRQDHFQGSQPGNGRNQCFKGAFQDSFERTEYNCGWWSDEWYVKHELNGGILKTYHLDSCCSDCVGKPLSYRPCRTDSACHHKSEVRQVLAGPSGRVVLSYHREEASHGPVTFPLFPVALAGYGERERSISKKVIHFLESGCLHMILRIGHCLGHVC